MKITNRLNLPAPLVRWCQKRFTPPKPGVVRCTHLIGPPQIRQLELRHWDDLEVDVADCVPLMMGSAFHSLLEGEAGEDSVHELYLNLPIGDWWVSGIADRVVKRNGTVRIEDWKTTSAWGFVRKNVDEKLRQYELQLNVYAYLYGKMYGEQVTELRVFAWLRDWSQSMASRNPDYPQTNLITCDLPLWSEREQADFILQRLAMHQSTLPYRCTDEDRWIRSEWAVMKGANKRATKVWATEDEAREHVEALGGLPYHVEHRPGEPKRCQGYCNVAPLCPQWQSEKAQYEKGEDES